MAVPVESWLRKECQRGLVERYGEVTPGLTALGIP